MIMSFKSQTPGGTPGKADKESAGGAMNTSQYTTSPARGQAPPVHLLANRHAGPPMVPDLLSSEIQGGESMEVAARTLAGEWASFYEAQLPAAARRGSREFCRIFLRFVLARRLARQGDPHP